MAKTLYSESKKNKIGMSTYDERAGQATPTGGSMTVTNDGPFYNPKSKLGTKTGSIKSMPEIQKRKKSGNY